MKGYFLDISSPVAMSMTGKFKAPDMDWIHLNRYLLDYELILMTEGELFIACDHTKYHIQKGDYLLMPPYSNQYGYKTSYCSFYWLHFTLSHDPHLIDINDDSKNSLPGKIILPVKDHPTNPERIGVLMKQLQDSSLMYRDNNLNNYLSTAILCELFNQHYTAGRSLKKIKKQQIYNDIMDYIRRNIHKKILVTEIANHFGYNEKYLSHAFKNFAGMSLKKYIFQQKMDLAKFILTDTNNSIQEISLQVGYDDSHNFMKAFKRLSGLTPTEYRNAYSKRMLNNK